MTSASPDLRTAHLTGHLRRILQAGSLAVMVGLLVSFAASLPLRLRHLLTPASTADAPGILGLPPLMEAGYTSRLGAVEVEALRSLGLSLGVYATYLLTFELGLALVCAVVGLFIFWRGSEGWLALWVALMLVILGTSSVSPEMPTLAAVWPGWLAVFICVGMLGMVSHLHFLLLAPDGRFVPRWTLRLAAGFAGFMLALAGYAVFSARYWGVWASTFTLLPGGAVWVVLLGIGTLSQGYRYRHVSSPIERQQTKWVVLGLTGITLGFLINVALLITAASTSGLARVWINLARTPIVNLCLLALPICLAFSILRYRLWDIDVLIRRTLIYSLLTGLLALTYFASVLGLESMFRLFTGQGQNSLVVVLSTLAIAALFVPFRQRIQAFIDRRFYRQKYDAARTIAAFAASARDEVELEHLTGRLLEVVQDTMQPSDVSLWLQPSMRASGPGERPT